MAPFRKWGASTIYCWRMNSFVKDAFSSMPWRSLSVRGNLRSKSSLCMKCLTSKCSLPSRIRMAVILKASSLIFKTYFWISNGFGKFLSLFSMIPRMMEFVNTVSSKPSGMKYRFEAAVTRRLSSRSLMDISIRIGVTTKESLRARSRGSNERSWDT